MILLVTLLIITIILYLARKFGYMDIVQCVLLAIIAFGTFCPETLRHYIFFQMNLNDILVGIPTEVMNSEKIKALEGLNQPNIGQTLSNLTNSLVDVLSQKPIDTSQQLNEQTRILTSIDQKLTDANTIAEVSLEQYANGQNVALNKLSSINNAINMQTKELKVVINNPIGIIDSLNNINSHVKPTIKMLSELNEINYKLGQEKQILTDGFSKLLQAEGNNTLAKDLQNFSNQLSTKFDAYQANIEKSLQNMQSEIAIERAENKKLLEQVQMSSLADIEIAREDAEQRIAAAEQMVNNYRKHESLGTHSYKSGVDLSKVDSNGVNQAAAGVGLVSAATWVLKILRIV